MLCQEGAVKYNDSICIYVEQEQVYSWQAARDKCHSRGGELASIHSYEEQDFIAGGRASK